METPVRGATGSAGPTINRREVLWRWLRWSAAAGAALMLYPLIRFSGHRIPPKPRLVEVPAPLPTSGVHADHDFLLFANPQGTTAVSRICTHLGCRLNYQADKQYLECPCHHSRFTTEGRRIAGPAEKDLTQYQVTEKKDGEGRVTAYVVHL
ncbi:MAG: Rieske (2Fe-2S) protein [Proteobacteria bacterium]|nr:Rieske (2Fe-2S) protein [Pseudomonadota bacterium]